MQRECLCVIFSPIYTSKCRILSSLIDSPRQNHFSSLLILLQTCVCDTNLPALGNSDWIKGWFFQYGYNTSMLPFAVCRYTLRNDCRAIRRDRLIWGIRHSAIMHIPSNTISIRWQVKWRRWKCSECVLLRIMRNHYSIAFPMARIFLLLTAHHSPAVRTGIDDMHCTFAQSASNLFDQIVYRLECVLRFKPQKAHTCLVLSWPSKQSVRIIVKTVMNISYGHFLFVFVLVHVLLCVFECVGKVVRLPVANRNEGKQEYATQRPSAGSMW